MFKNDTAEKLLLFKKGKNEICIESDLKQHHVDGIRFLFKQFISRKPGVIFNYNDSLNNSSTVALFLGSVRHLLEKPILILCKDTDKYTWLELFQKSRRCYNVVLCAPNPFVKKSVFINTLDNLDQFTRRDWSALVVDHEGLLSEKNLMSKLNGVFKIWITCDDIKKNLPTFTKIYKWIYPKNTFVIDEFVSKTGKSEDLLSKEITFEAFIEDLVCRDHNYISTIEPPIPCVLKKNKDVTGTKIKRSKRTLHNTENSSNNEPGPSAPKIIKPSNSNTECFENSNVYNVGNDKNDFGNKQTDLDIETFIRNKKPIKLNLHNSVTSLDSMPSSSQESDTDFLNKINHQKNNVITMISSDSDDDNSTVESNVLIEESFMESDDNAYELETQELNDENTHDFRIIVDNDNAISENKNSYELNYTNVEASGNDYQIEESGLGKYKGKSIITNGRKSNGKRSNKKSSFCSSITELRKTQISEGDTQKMDIDAKLNGNRILKEQQNEEIIKDNVENEGINTERNSSKLENNKVNSCDDIVKIEQTGLGITKDKSDIHNAGRSNKIVVTSKVTELQKKQTSEGNAQKMDIDAKLTEHENRIFKKYKGTILDSIF